MSQQKRVLLLIFIMAVVSVVVTGITINILYNAALNEEKARILTDNFEIKIIDIKRGGVYHVYKSHRNVD